MPDAMRTATLLVIGVYSEFVLLVTPRARTGVWAYGPLILVVGAWWCARGRPTTCVCTSRFLRFFCNVAAYRLDRGLAFVTWEVAARTYKYLAYSSFH